jgi:CHAD domain-containing protein
MAKAREIEGLDCGGSVGAGVRLVLRSRVEEMCAFRVAALDPVDPEGVHDMRVASRRVRSLVRDFSPYLRKQKLRRSSVVLKGIADALGNVRDQDVAIMALEKLAVDAPPEVSRGIEQFVNERRVVRERSLSRLEEALREDALGEFREQFNAALEESLKISRKRRDGEDEERMAGGATFRHAGRDIITARLEDLQDLSASLYRPLKTRPLHRMRIAAKRLRYAVELFDPCWNASLAIFSKEIARLQTSLGELHDCDLWIAALGATLREASEDTAAEKRNAAFWLLAHFIKERASHLQDALMRWQEWELTGFQTHLASVLDDNLPAVQP